MGDPDDCPKCGKREKKEVLGMLREMWLKGDSPLHRIYSSWEQLELHVEIRTEKAEKEEKHVIQPCPNCGAKQKITKPLEIFLPYQNCKACGKAYYINKDLTVRKLTADEKAEIPKSWIKIVDDLSENKCAIIFKLE